ncbi:hypothetical protein [Saccharopolyspora elongata]|uniref:hypothetical protein n=1 Tax=Saccharopolyspora elongata TaxID=2530387 RepID=UPI001A9E50A0|nr:hypothetical protein [Saccharopolyspora elongata]
MIDRRAVLSKRAAWAVASAKVTGHAGDADDFIERNRRTPAYSSALYAASLLQKVRPEAVRGIFESMVEPSDHGELMAKFLSLPFRRMFSP